MQVPSVRAAGDTRSNCYGSLSCIIPGRLVFRAYKALLFICTYMDEDESHDWRLKTLSVTAGLQWI